VSTPTAAERVERAFWGQPKRVQQALLAEGERALLANDERLAETLFARARDFAGDEAQGAYGLARVRLAQGDLEGAQGWIGQAIKQWPRRAEYRALHAEILQRFGRGAEAQLERALARSLPRPSPDFPAETQSR
jgi:thioredoxin-like negative regulator of GroEL